MARKKDPVRRWLLEVLETRRIEASETPEQKRQRWRRLLLEAREQQRQREEAKRRREEAKWRRHLEKLGTTPEEFDEGCREFRRKFYPDQE